MIEGGGSPHAGDLACVATMGPISAFPWHFFSSPSHITFFWQKIYVVNTVAPFEFQKVLESPKYTKQSFPIYSIELKPKEEELCKKNHKIIRKQK
jgi:hypothetical protein